MKKDKEGERGKGDCEKRKGKRSQAACWHCWGHTSQTDRQTVSRAALGPEEVPTMQAGCFMGPQVNGLEHKTCHPFVAVRLEALRRLKDTRVCGG